MPRVEAREISRRGFLRPHDGSDAGPLTDGTTRVEIVVTCFRACHEGVPNGGEWTQSQPGARDHRERTERSAIEFRQVITGHVLYDAATTFRLNSIRANHIQPEDRVCNPAEALRSRTDRRARNRAAHGRIRSGWIEGEFPSLGARRFLDLAN